MVLQADVDEGKSGVAMIEFRDLYKSFGNRAVLQGLTFSVVPGEIYGLLGPNGAGKTTAINILCNLLDADSGTVLIQGNEVSELTKYLVGIVPQKISIYKDLTCRENLIFFASLYGIRGAHRHKRVEELLSLFDLTGYANTEVSKLSGGWQRRVNIAVALVHSPTILILDEPTAGLDIEARYELWDVINKLRDTGAAILLTTHQLDEAERLCLRLGILQNGQIVCEGSLHELRSVVPAKQLAIVTTNDEASVSQRASSFGWAHRYYGGNLTLLLPHTFTLKEIIDRFEGLSITSMTLQEVGLEHIYVETVNDNPSSSRTTPT